MKRLKLYLCSFLFSLLCVIQMPMVVFASETGDSSTSGEEAGLASQVSRSTGDAIDDILLNERFDGAVDSISWLTNIMDNVTIQIISVASFLIIAFALLKNVLAGSYCAFPVFCDAVHEAHQANEQITIRSAGDYFRQGKVLDTSVSGIKRFLLGLVPDVKALTDFEEQEIAPKDYFLKAIPQMLACVIIGVFIYNGYYRDTAAVVGRFGSEAITRVLVSADPVGLVDKVFNNVGMPEFATQDSPYTEDKIVYKASKGLYSAIVTKHHDLSTMNQKQSLASAVESWVSTCVKECTKYTQDDFKATYKYTIKVGLSPEFEGKNNEYSDGATFIWYTPLKDFDFDSAIPYDGAEYAKLQVVFTKVSSGDNDGTSGGNGSGGGGGGNSVPTPIRDYTQIEDVVISVKVSVEENSSGVQVLSSPATVNAPSGFRFYISGSSGHSYFNIMPDAKISGNYYSAIELPRDTAFVKDDPQPLGTSIWAVNVTEKERARVSVKMNQQ